VADWRREYGADLMDELDNGLPWHRFCALVSGLSLRSVWRMVSADEPDLITDETQARAAIASWRKKGA
jgi:hypothetical protein